MPSGCASRDPQKVQACIAVRCDRSSGCRLPTAKLFGRSRKPVVRPHPERGTWVREIAVAIQARCCRACGICSAVPRGRIVRLPRDFLHCANWAAQRRASHSVGSGRPRGWWTDDRCRDGSEAKADTSDTGPAEEMSSVPVVRRAAAACVWLVGKVVVRPQNCC